MRVCGLITEYNPFHNGHIHHMKEAREKTGADYLIVVMSGNFVQRGTPAIIDKYERTRMALDGGADLVLEMPTLFATASAESFASAGVNLLYQLGCVDSICFGTECGDLEVIDRIATVLNDEPWEFKQNLRDSLKSGLNFPSARAVGLHYYFKDSIEDLEEILASPNNILGIEYLRALKRLNSDIKPLAVKRWKTDYLDRETPYQDVASATAIRHMLYDEDGVTGIVPYVTNFTARELALKYGVCTPVRTDDLSAFLQYRIFNEKDHLADYLDFSPELAERVNNLLPDIYTFKEWASALKTKSFTHTRINRALLHLVLNMKTEDLQEYKEEDYVEYARILGFRAESAALLGEIKKNTPIPLISKMADAKNILTPKAMRLLQMDIDAANVYRTVVYQKFGTLLKDEYTAGIIKY